MANDVMHCYFCGSQRVKLSLSQRTILFRDKEYRFIFCQGCRGFSLFPTLTDAQLFELYSSDYVDQGENEQLPSEESPPTKFSDLEAYLKERTRGLGESFLDYGCGADPISFKFAQENGLTPSGMELSADVRELAELNTGVKLLSREEIQAGNRSFDIVFLGDVLEHLVDPIVELKFLRMKMSPKGILLAQGPLQGAMTLTHLIVRFFAWTTRGKLTSYPPYHVSLASSISMKKLLETSGFQLTYMKTFEVDWPAPTFQDLKRSFTLRNLILYTSKQIDLVLARMLPNYGTRYFLSATLENQL